jgi:4'-phosphopantetheinyl transferase
MTDIHRWGKEPCNPVLETGEIQVWLANLDEQQADDSWEVLSEEEKDRAARLRDLLSSRRFANAHGILRRLLGAYLTQDPRKLTFRYGAQGKPALAGAAEKALSFNLSHSGELAVYAIAKGLDVGVDIEYLRPLDDLESMAGMVLSPTEWTNLKAEPAEEKLKYFFALWTYKEAVLKVTGNGLTGSMKAVEFINFKSSPETSEFLLPDGRSCQVNTLPLDEGYVGAVAAAHEA